MDTSDQGLFAAHNTMQRPCQMSQAPAAPIPLLSIPFFFQHDSRTRQRARRAGKRLARFPHCKNQMPNF